MNDDNERVLSSSDIKTSFKYSLAYFETTPRYAIYLISSLMIISHVLFLYGQTYPMWRLFYMLEGNVTLTATNWESKSLFKELNLSNPVHFEGPIGKDLDTFTYWFAIKQLWNAVNLPEKLGPRIAAVVLILFSGVWPHVKLLGLHIYWLASVSENVRTSMLYWLSTFGKWSLADVFVVCVMIGVLNLDLYFDANVIIPSIEHIVPELADAIRHNITSAEAKTYVCETLLKFSCNHWYDLKCTTCKSFVGHAYSDPKIVSKITNKTLNGIHVAGEGGLLQLRIGGLRGIYVFCFAVIASLALSFLIDVYDHHAKAFNAKIRHASLHSTEPRYSIHAADDDSSALVPDDAHVILLRRIPKTVWSKKKYIFLCIMSLVTLVSVIYGTVYPSMRRQVLGSLPVIADGILGDVEWQKDYSMWNLAIVAGADGGADYMLLCTFAFFCVFGPILRSFFCIIHLILPATKSQHKRLLTIVNFLGAFCAWDVFLVALLLVDMEMPQLTNTILDDRDTPICKILYDTGKYPRSCFEVEYVTLPKFFFVVSGFATLIFVSTLTTSLGFHSLDPYLDGDSGGPYCFTWCPKTIFDLDQEFEESDDDDFVETIDHRPLLTVN